MSFAEFVCPTCRGALAENANELRCERCAATYPGVAGIACLLPDAAAFLDGALSRLARYRAAVGERAAALLEEARKAPAQKVAQRLTLLANGLLAETHCLEGLFEPMRKAALAHPAPGASLSALFDDPLSTTRYSEHLFRDWVWGEAESGRIRALVERHVVDQTRTLAVFGAGTARLALELALHPRVDEVIALDVNPLPFLVAARLFAGSSVDLVEFPLVPLSGEHAAIPRRIEPPAARADNLRLVFADALRAPLADDSLDAVVTPWFIDAVGADVSEVAAAINRVLRAGGRWINVGPLSYSGGPSQAYSFEEVCDCVRDNGFELGAPEQHSLPYFDSPVSGTCRVDRTYVFAARKVGGPTPAVARLNATPWLDDPTLPIPPSASLTATLQRSMMTAGIASLVDGTRSAVEIAALLSQSWNVEPRALLPSICALLRESTTA